MIESEIRAKLNGAMRDALRKEKVPFVDLSTQSREGAIVVTVVTGLDSQEKVNKIFGEVQKRGFKGTDVRCEFKTPEDLAAEKATTLRAVLEILTGPEPYTLATIAERTGEASWVIDKCLRDLSLKGVV